MTLRTIGVFVSTLTITAAAFQGPREAGTTPAGQDREMAAIKELLKRDIDATLVQDQAALADLWTEDAVRLGPGAPPDLGREAIRATNARFRAALPGLKVISYVPEAKDITISGEWAFYWGTFTARYVEAPGGEEKQMRAKMLSVLRKGPDGRWRVFRGMSTPE